MRTFTWLLTLALGILCLACWASAEFAASWFHFSPVPLPGFTRLILQPHTWLLFVPIPWVIYSTVLSTRKEISASAALIFAGTIVLVMTVVFCSVLVAGLIPLLPLQNGR
jgi:hypothetical protein